MSARGGNEGRQAASGGGTQTQVLCESVGQSTAPPSLVLKLKSKKKASVTWEEGTVNNENCGRKSSKRCCIYHARKAFAESDSDESDSDIEEAEKEDAALGPEAKKRNYQRHHA